MQLVCTNVISSIDEVNVRCRTLRVPKRETYFPNTIKWVRQLQVKRGLFQVDCELLVSVLKITMMSKIPFYTSIYVKND